MIGLVFTITNPNTQTGTKVVFPLVIKIVPSRLTVSANLRYKWAQSRPGDPHTDADMTKCTGYRPLTLAMSTGEMQTTPIIFVE